MGYEIWKKGYVNQYEYEPNEKLNYLLFEEMTEEWLDFIVACRRGNLTNMILWRGRNGRRYKL